MKKKIALVVYPNFSFQEIANLSALFRWYYDSQTVVFSSDKEPVVSEEGFTVLPQRSFEEFSKEDYDCLILSGCSDFREAIEDEKLDDFLKQFREEEDFVIGAICAGPMFLSKSGILDGKKFTNSLYAQMNERFAFIDEKNLIYAPLVEDGNVITATGEAFNLFAVAVARKLGYDCPDNAYAGMGDKWCEDDFKFYLDEKELETMEEAFGKFFK